MIYNMLNICVSCLGVHIDIFLKFNGCYVTLTNNFIDMLFEDIMFIMLHGVRW